jgi:hypothetical protein
LSFWPYILYSFTTALTEGIDTLLQLRDCYTSSILNGSNPHVVCATNRWDIAPVDLPMIVPALDHHFQIILNVFDSCYDNSTNATVSPPGKARMAVDGDEDEDEDEPFLPGCPEDMWDSDVFDESGFELDKAVYQFLTKECKCGCTWFNEPRMRAAKPQKG